MSSISLGSVKPLRRLATKAGISLSSVMVMVTHNALDSVVISSKGLAHLDRGGSATIAVSVCSGAGRCLGGLLNLPLPPRREIDFGLTGLLSRMGLTILSVRLCSNR